MALQDTMNAVLIKNGKGPIENLYIGKADRPKVTSKGQVAVKVKMFGLNRMDISQRQGNYPVPPGTTPILGVEFSGTVVEVGPEVTTWKEGDEVLGLVTGGAYAEYVVADDFMLLPKPKHLSWAEAAAIPEAWLTAFQVLFLVGHFKKGESVLIHAGGSGVGIAANQLARFFGGTHVITTAGSQEKLDFLKTMDRAPTDTINYKSEDFSKRVHEITGGKGVDLVIDFVGKDYWEKNLVSLALEGRMILVGLLSGAQLEQGSIWPILAKRLHIIGTGLRSRNDEYKAHLIKRFTEECVPRLRGEEEISKDATLRVYVHKVFPWSEIQETHREMEDNKNSGKIIVEVK